MAIFAALHAACRLAQCWRRARRPLPPGTCGVLRCAGIGFPLGVLTDSSASAAGSWIVPALVLVAGLDMKRRGATSLAIIASTPAGASRQLRHGAIDWPLTAAFLAFALNRPWLAVR